MPPAGSRHMAISASPAGRQTSPKTITTIGIPSGTKISPAGNETTQIQRKERRNAPFEARRVVGDVRERGEEDIRGTREQQAERCPGEPTGVAELSERGWPECSAEDERAELVAHTEDRRGDEDVPPVPDQFPPHGVRDQPQVRAPADHDPREHCVDAVPDVLADDEGPRAEVSLSGDHRGDAEGKHLGRLDEEAAHERELTLQQRVRRGRDRAQEDRARGRRCECGDLAAVEEGADQRCGRERQQRDADSGDRRRDRCSCRRGLDLVTALHDRRRKAGLGDQHAEADEDRRSGELSEISRLQQARENDEEAEIEHLRQQVAGAREADSPDDRRGQVTGLLTLVFSHARSS